MGRFFGGFGFTSSVSPPQTLSPTASMRSNTSEKSAQVEINNRIIYVTQDLQEAVMDGANRIRASYLNGLDLKKELILDKELLIEFLNHAKFYWHAWLTKTPEESSASERIENAFINNKNLSKEESDWVRETICDYKNIVKTAIFKSNSNPIPPIWMVHKKLVRKKCSSNIF